MLLLLLLLLFLKIIISDGDDDDGVGMTLSDADSQMNGNSVSVGDLEAAATWSGDPGEGNRSYIRLLQSDYSLTDVTLFLLLMKS